MDDKIINEIRSRLGTDKIVIGTNKVERLLMESKLSQVIVSSNIPEFTKKKLENLCKLNEKCSFNQISLRNDDLGAVCKKQFNISVIGLI